MWKNMKAAEKEKVINLGIAFAVAALYVRYQKPPIKVYNMYYYIAK